MKRRLLVAQALGAKTAAWQLCAALHIEMAGVFSLVELGVALAVFRCVCTEFSRHMSCTENLGCE